MFKVTAEASKKTGVKLVEFDGEMLLNEKHIKEEFCLAKLQQLTADILQNTTSRKMNW